MSAVAERVTFAEGLRVLADMCEKHPETIDPYGYTLNVFADTAEEMAEKAKTLGGRWDKDSLGEYFILRRKLGGGVVIEINGRRANICTRVQVGTREVKVWDEDAIEDFKANNLEPTIVEEPVYEWNCPESLLAEASQKERGEALIREHGGYREAVKATHPDHGGDQADFLAVQAAKP